MKIVQVLGWYFPENVGGTETYVAGLAQRLVAAGHEVVIAAHHKSGWHPHSYTHSGIVVFRYPVPKAPTRSEFRDTVEMRGVEHFHRWVAQQNADIVHFHGIATGIKLPELNAARRAGAKIILTLHTADLGFVCYRGTMMRWGERLCDGISEAAKCTACALHQRGLPKPLAAALGLTPSALAKQALKVPGPFGTAAGMGWLVRQYQSNLGSMAASVDKLVVLTQSAYQILLANRWPEDKMVVNRLGISHCNVHAKPGPSAVPACLPLKIAYFGRYEAIKGVEVLARAFASLPSTVPLLLELRGPASDESGRRLLHKVRSQLGSDPRVSFAPPVPPGVAPQVLAGYDVLCCPSLTLEGGPTVALEAYSVGTPIIGSRIGGLAELVRDGVNGCLLPPGAYQALALLFRRLAEDPLGTVDRWRAGISKPRTMDDIAADYVHIYGECLHSESEPNAS